MGGMVTQPVKLTTIRSFGTFLGSRLRVSVATRGGAFHCARGARKPRSDSAFSGASFGLTTLPSACNMKCPISNGVSGIKKLELHRASNEVKLTRHRNNIQTQHEPYKPQSAVLGHCFADGFASASQLEVEHFTVPGVPDNPNPTPHLVAHPLGSSCTHLPDIA